MEKQQQGAFGTPTDNTMTEHLLKRNATDTKSDAVAAVHPPSPKPILVIPAQIQPSAPPANAILDISPAGNNSDAKNSSELPAANSQDVKAGDLQNDKKDNDKSEHIHNISLGKKLASISLTSGSSYAAAVISAAQIKALLEHFTSGSISPALGFALLPWPTFINVWPLSHHENCDVLADQKENTNHSFLDLLREHPFEVILTVIAASAEGLITASCTLDLFNTELTTGTQFLAWTLGTFAAIQYALLDGKVLIQRMRLGCSYEEKDYVEFLKKTDWWTYIKAVGLSNLVPITGALGFAALSFAECQEILEQMLDNVGGKLLGSDIANLISAPLSLIYGGMHWALYGHRTKVWLAQCYTKSRDFFSFIQPQNDKPYCTKKLLQSLILLSAISEGALVGSALGEATQLFFDNTGATITLAITGGMVGILLNLFVEGREFLALGYEEKLEDVKEDAMQGSSNYIMRDFFADLTQVGIFYLARQLIEVLIIPNNAQPGDEDKEVTVGSYGYSAMVCALIYALQELYYTRKLATRNSFVPVDHADMFPQEEPKSGEWKQNTTAYLKKRFNTAPRSVNYPSYARIGTQFIIQAVVPIVTGYYIEWGLRNSFQNDSLTASSALSDAQYVAPVFAGILTVMSKRLINFIFRSGGQCKKSDLPVYMGAYDEKDIERLTKKYERNECAIVVGHVQAMIVDEKEPNPYFDSRQLLINLKTKIDTLFERLNAENKNGFIPIQITRGYWALLWLHKSDNEKYIYCLDPLQHFLAAQLPQWTAIKPRIQTIKIPYAVNPVDSGAWIVHAIEQLGKRQEPLTGRLHLPFNILQVRQQHQMQIATCNPSGSAGTPAVEGVDVRAQMPRASVCDKISHSLKSLFWSTPASTPISVGTPSQYGAMGANRDRSDSISSLNYVHK